MRVASSKKIPLNEMTTFMFNVPHPVQEFNCSLNALLYIIKFVSLKMTATFISISNTSALLIVILSLIGVVLEIFDYFGYYNFYLDVRFSTEELMATGKYTEEQVEKFNLEWRKSSDKEKIKKYNN
jgi:hypothetical protein